MAKGWIRLHRELADNWIWSDKEPFDKRSAWIDLLLMANHKDFKTVKGMTLVHRKRGEVNTSVLYLSKRWGWSRNKVYRYLELLKEDGMIRIDGTTDGTTITIENYEKYQIAPTADETTTETTDGTTSGTTNGTYDNNVKECNKNGNKRKVGNFIPPTLSEVQDYIKEKGYHIDAESFIDFYESKGWMVGKNKMKDWKASVRTWEKRNGKRVGEVHDRSVEQNGRGIPRATYGSGSGNSGNRVTFPSAHFGFEEEE